MTPSIDDIRRDDELLDELGGRKTPHRSDAATDALSFWVQEIDAPDRPAVAGRYARAKRTPARLGVVAAITVATLSISGVAAAVGGVPGISRVAEQMGFVHRSADFGSGAGGPVSTHDAVSASSSPSSDVVSTSTTAPPPPTSTVRSTTRATHRVLPGALMPAATAHNRPGHSATRAWQTVRTVGSSPSTRSSSAVPSSTASSAPSSSSRSSIPTSTRSPSPSSSTSASTRPTRPAHPPKPPLPLPWPPWLPTPSATASRTASPSASSTTPPTLSSTSSAPSSGSSSASSSASSTSSSSSTSSLLGLRDGH